MNKILFTLILLFTSLSLAGQVTATFEIEPGTEFETLPNDMRFSLSEPMNGVPPTVYIKGPTLEKKLICTRPDASDYQNYQIWVSYYVKGDLLEEIKAAGEFSLVVTLCDGTELEPFVYKLKKPITVTFEIEPGTEFETLPNDMRFSLSEPMNGVPPTVYIKGPTLEKKLICTRPDASDYQNYQIWVSYYVKGDLLEEIKAAGEFSLVVTLCDGTELEPFVYKLKKPITVTFEIEPGTELEAIPDQMNFSLSEPMNGVPPTVYIKGPTLEKKLICTRPVTSDYQNYMIWVAYYVKGDLLEEIKEAGEFSLVVTLCDGTELAPFVYKLKPENIPFEVTFVDKEGSVFAGLPEQIEFALNQETTGALPKAKINGSYEADCYSKADSATEFYIKAAEEIPAEAYANGELSIDIYIPETDETAAGTKFYVVPADLSWEAATGSEFGKVFSNLPATLSYTLSEELPADGILESGIMLASASDLDIVLPCTIEGKTVVYDLSSLSGEDTQKIVDNENFTMVLRLANKDLTAAYTLNIRIQPVTLGYCNDDFDQNMSSFGSEGAATTIAAAIKIPAAKLEALKGGKITKLRIGMDAGLERVYAWIRPDLSSPAIVMKKVEDIESGWNEIELDVPYVITGEEIFIGYSGYQPTGVKAIRCGGADRPDGCWLAIKDVWSDYSDKGYGTLYIQAIGEAILPSADLGVDNLSVDKSYYKNDEQLKAQFTVINSGADDINGYTISWKIDEGEAVETVIDTALPSDSRSDHSFELSLAGLTDGMHTLTVACVINDSDKTDQIEGNDVVSVPVAVYSTDYKRTVLLEQFTTINCVNCPNGTASVKAAVAERDDIAWIAHHTGFGVDEFTIDESKTMLDYGVLGAPSLMIDRTPLNGNSTAPLTIGYSNPTAGGEIIAGYIDQCVAVPAFAGLKVENTYNEETRELAVTVTCEKNEIFSEFYPLCNLTVCLTEDGLKGSKPQMGADIDYIHDHVLRQVFTPVTGTPVEWDGSAYTARFTTVLNTAWEAGRMHIIAALNKPFDADNLGACRILNAAIDKVDAQVGIDSVRGDERIYINESGSVCGEGLVSIEVYSANGMRVANAGLTTGLYIIRAVDSEGKTITAKTFIK